MQAVVSGVLWIGYGFMLFRNSREILSYILSIPRKRRAIHAPVLLVLGLGTMTGGLLILLNLGGFGPNGMSLPAWAAVTALGLFFIRTQVYAAGMMVTLGAPAVTKGDAVSSVTPESSNETTE